MLNNFTVLFCFLSLLSLNEAYRILVHFPMQSRSHGILGNGIVDTLLDAGHEVVHITSFPKGKPVANYKEINVSSVYEDIMGDSKRPDFLKLKNMVGKGMLTNSLFIFYFVYDVNTRLLAYPELVDFLSDPNEKFDAVVVEWFFYDAIAGLASLFQCPLIWVSPTEAHWEVLRLVDETPNPAYNVEILSESFPPLSFWERVNELWQVVKNSVVLNAVVIPFEKYRYNSVFTELAKKRGVTMPSYTDAVYNGSLLLLNSHPSIGASWKLPQNVKNVGGYHINPIVAPLPNDLQKVMDETKHGIIYFSMGSNLRSSEMSDHMKSSLLKMFGKLKQTVIWKFEEDLKDVPSNVKLVKWAPQTSILAHPNLELFITHGGLLSTTEVVHFGVPVIGVPVAADQFVNVKGVERKGLGILVTLAEDMADAIYVAVQKILTNPSYKEKAKEISRIYHSRPVPPRKEVTHWVEHVISTGGAPHLRSPALLVPWYQKLYLDLAALLVITTIVLRKLWILFRGKTAKVKTN